MMAIPTRDTNDPCEGECRDRVFEGEFKRQILILLTGIPYSVPAEISPS